MGRVNLKKIRVDDLQVGMYVVNIGRSWFRHPFLRNHLKITSEKQIEKFKNHDISEVYIDPERGLDVSPAKFEWDDGLLPPVDPGSARSENPGGGTKRPPFIVPPLPPPTPGPALQKGSSPGEPDSPDSPPLTEKSESVAFWEKNVGVSGEGFSDQDAIPRIPFDDHVPYSKELETARVVQQEAQDVVRNIMNDVRMGKSIESERVKKVVSSMVESILRNPDALVSLTQMRSYDEYTFVHSLNVCILCLSMARHINLSRDEMMQIGIGSLLHDVGKMKLDPSILKKPDTLSATEWVEMRKHPIYSLQIMEASHEIPEESKQLALQHHERYNGSGYPFGLKGENIGLFGQIAGMIDFYDAITTDRTYRKALQPHEGIRQIYEKGHAEFNRLLVERFIQCIGIYPFGTLVLLDTEEMAIVCGNHGDSLLRPQVLVIYRNSKMPYPEPFLADLSEKVGGSSWYRRSIIMPLDPGKWNIRLESYLEDIRRNQDVRIPAF